MRRSLFQTSPRPSLVHVRGSRWHTAPNPAPRPSPESAHVSLGTAAPRSLGGSRPLASDNHTSRSRRQSPTPPLLRPRLTVRPRAFPRDGCVSRQDLQSAWSPPVNTSICNPAEPTSIQADLELAPVSTVRARPWARRAAKTSTTPVYGATSTPRASGRKILGQPKLLINTSLFAGHPGPVLSVNGSQTAS